MRHFLSFIAIIFAGLFVALFFKERRDPSRDTRPVVRVFGPSSFISQWGPGPWLKQIFEKSCECRLEYVDGADSTILFQRLKSESRTGADVVVGLDQFDLEQASQLFEWKPLQKPSVEFDENVASALNLPTFLPYDWGVLAFVMRKSQLTQLPQTLDDFLGPAWKGQISMQDPRTSTPGMQFLFWLIQLKGEEGAFEYLKAFNKQVKAYSVSWSSAYGLFTKGQTKTAFSYVTSPIYHMVEEKDTDVIAAEFQEGHPLQFEFVGVPSICKQCELGEKFVALLMSPEGQKIIMEKNYMFPVIKSVREGTAFAQIPPVKSFPINIPKINDRERILKRWSALRRLE